MPMITGSSSNLGSIPYANAANARSTIPCRWQYSSKSHSGRYGWDSTCTTAGLPNPTAVDRQHLSGAQSGEIETQHRDAMQLQPFRDMPRRALAAGEAMREQSRRTNRTVRSVEQCGKFLTRGIWKIESFSWHRRLLRMTREF